MAETNPLTEKRLKDAVAARSLWNKLRTSSEGRRKDVSQVLNQLNGGKPFDDRELVESGQGWRCNVNFRDAASTLEQVLISYWRLLHDSTNLVNIIAYSQDPQAEKYAASMQKNFNRFVQDWSDGYVRNYLQLAMNHVGFGVGVGIFNDPKSPRWEVVRMGDLEVPLRAKSDVSSLPVVMVSMEMEVTDLWAKIRTEKAKEAAAALGWNVEVLRKVLFHAVEGRAPKPHDNLIEIEDRIRNNDLEVTATSSLVKVVHAFVREYDGKISTYLFAPEHEHGEQFLFDDSQKESRPDSMRRKLFAVFFEAGNGLFWGSKGFGQKNYQLATIQNRLKSRAVDRTLLDALNFRDLSDGGLSQFPVVNVGPFNILPKELEQVPTYPSGNSILETIGMIDSQTSNNNARYRDTSRQVAQTDTATQANILANLQSQVDVANATLYLKQIANNLFAEQLRILRDPANKSDPDVKAFWKRCVDEDGVPEEFLTKAEISVTTGADPGAASLALQGEYAKELMQFSADPDINTRWAKERYITARFGASAVDKALRPVDASGDIAAQRFALMENSDMGEGQSLPVDPKDVHAGHIPVHLQPAMVIIDRYETSGQISPEALVALQNLIPHLEQHFEYLKLDKLQDPLRKQLWPEFTRVMSAAEGIFNQIERMQAEAQQAGAPPPQEGGGGVAPAAAIGAMSQQ